MSNLEIAFRWMQAAVVSGCLSVSLGAFAFWSSYSALRYTLSHRIEELRQEEAAKAEPTHPERPER